MFTRLRVLSASLVIAAVPLFGGVTRDGNTIVVTATPSTTVAWMLRDSDLGVRTSGLATDTDGDGVIRIDNPVPGSHSWWGGIDLTSGQMMQMRLYVGNPLYDAPHPFPQKIFLRDGGHRDLRLRLRAGDTRDLDPGRRNGSGHRDPDRE